jgi:SAM-dependent methyltransferase
MGAIVPTENDKWAEFYDELHEWNDPSECVRFISARTTCGPIGEFAVGTGRVAVPLGNVGHTVFGIDISQAMIDRLNSKRSPNVIGIVGDACDTCFPEKVELAYIVFNSLFSISSFEQQQHFFGNAFAQLQNNGVLIIEGFVPDHSRFPGGRSCQVFERSPTRRLVVSSKHDMISQRIDVEVFYIREDKFHRLTSPARYIHLSEMDLMAKLAGFHLTGRYGNWKEGPLSDYRGNAISVYKRIG